MVVIYLFISKHLVTSKSMKKVAISICQIKFISESAFLAGSSFVIFVDRSENPDQY
jgi:hypothetical protein